MFHIGGDEFLVIVRGENLVSTATEDEEYTPEKAVNGLQGWVDCFDGANLLAHYF